MTEVEFQIVKSVGFVTALLLAAGIERLSPHARSAGSWRTNGTLWAVNAVLLGLVCAGCACTVARFASKEAFGLLNATAAPGWLAIPLSVLGLDLVSYAWHRANHHVPLLWRFHRVHHSDDTFTVTTALRFHPGELLLALPVRLAAVALLGVSVTGVIVFEVVFAFANFVEHGDIDLANWLETKLGWLLITPALHRRHHSTEQQQRDTNYGTILSLWDRVFGSYGPNRSDLRVTIGLPGIAKSLGAREALLMPTHGPVQPSARG